MDDTDLKYDEYCRIIAESRDLSHLIEHFREHVSEHYYRHNTCDQTNLDIWLIGILNFMYILDKKKTRYYKRRYVI